MEAAFDVPHLSLVPRRANKLSADPVARRLALTRIALGYDKQEAFARAAGMPANRYNPWETGKRRLPLDGARQICERLGLTLEWLYDGRAGGLPHDLVMRLAALGAVDLGPLTMPSPERRARK